MGHKAKPKPNWVVESNRESTIIAVLIFISITLCIGVVLLFKDTVINPSTLFFIYLLSASFYVVLNKFLIKLELNIFLKLILIAFLIGGTINFALLSANMYLPNKSNYNTENYYIIKTGFTTKGHSPTADIEINGIVKGFSFNKNDIVTSNNTIKVKSRTGKLGWKIIEYYQLDN